MPGKTTKPIAGISYDLQAPGTGFVQPLAGQSIGGTSRAGGGGGGGGGGGFGTPPTRTGRPGSAAGISGGRVITYDTGPLPVGRAAGQEAALARQMERMRAG